MNRFVYGTCRSLARTFLRVWHRWRTEGGERVPATGGVLLISNHASHLDPPAVGCDLRRPVRYLARSTLGAFPPLRWLFGALGVVFVDRGGAGAARSREGLVGAIEALAGGEVVCIFAEGTRTTTGRMAPFERGAFLVLRRAPVPVVPVGIEGSFAAMRRGAWFPRPARITVRYGEPMTAAEILAPGGADELHRRVRALSGEAVPPAPGVLAAALVDPATHPAAAGRAPARSVPVDPPVGPSDPVRLQEPILEAPLSFRS